MAKASAGTWIVQRTGNERFPYRLQILAGDGRKALTLRAQDRWPAANPNIFCLRDVSTGDAESSLEEVERLPIVALQRRGVRLSLVLDRKRYRRCDFLFLNRPYKNRSGETYEQIYWQTQTSMVQRRPKTPAKALRIPDEFSFVIDSGERHAWRFPAVNSTRARLAIGDYALSRDGELLAVAERKTFENMLADFGVMPLLHQRMLELAGHPHNALVIEAPYEDFLDRRKLHHYTPSFCASRIAGLYAAHPRLRIVFCANRKIANLWTSNFFAAFCQNAPKTGASRHRTG